MPCWFHFVTPVCVPLITIEGRFKFWLNKYWCVLLREFQRDNSTTKSKLIQSSQLLVNVCPFSQSFNSHRTTSYVKPEMSSSKQCIQTNQRSNL